MRTAAARTSAAPKLAASGAAPASLPTAVGATLTPRRRPSLQLRRRSSITAQPVAA